MFYTKSLFLSAMGLICITVYAEAKNNTTACPALSSKNDIVCVGGVCSIQTPHHKLTGKTSAAVVGSPKIKASTPTPGTLTSTGECSYPIEGDKQIILQVN